MDCRVELAGLREQKGPRLKSPKYLEIGRTALPSRRNATRAFHLCELVDPLELVALDPRAYVGFLPTECDQLGEPLGSKTIAARPHDVNRLEQIGLPLPVIAVKDVEPRLGLKGRAGARLRTPREFQGVNEQGQIRIGMTTPR